MLLHSQAGRSTFLCRSSSFTVLFFKALFVANVVSAVFYFFLLEMLPMKLYVGNLSYTMTETELGELFTPHGSILNVNLISDHYTRQSKCFGYVQMADKDEGIIAMNALHGKRVNNRPLVVKEAPPRDERTGLPR